MYESSLGIHEIKLVIKSGPCVHDRCRVAETANSSFYPREISTWYNGGWLIIYSHLCSISRLENPEPVPPPKEWKIKKPCKPLHCSVSLRILSKVRSIISFPEKSQGHLPTTVGSRSTKTARGTCFPEPVSEKNALKESSPEPTLTSLGICPSG
ncbi:hypothetical protein ALC57_15403 [Trachymyrmex cornetzi]|uniref:Uncharacterized protein n=1 Tax=Trachymyrmex cornetzi TaxID=471704 RepID=A0A151IX74_9HYME|nr:hypothetical protein ALC57_15403 [Trachymyrmex cornetzi]